jgi:glutamyl-tRNA reductase
VLGEVQILGQVKDAYNLAQQGGSTGVFLNRLLAAALHAGKRARSETEIGAGAVSFTSAAVALTRRIFSDLSDKHILIVGSGEFGRLAAEHFAAERPAGLLIVNRTRQRAEALAAGLGGEAGGLEDLPSMLRRADVVVTAVRTDRPVISEDMVRRALRDKSGGTMVFADLGVPRNVDPAVARLDNAFLYGLESLQTIVDQSLSRRRREMPRVEAIIEDELGHFFDWVRALEVTPVVRELRERFESIRARETEKHMRRLPAADRGAVEALTRAIVNKLLHHPTTKIRGINVGSEDGLLRLDTVRDLFGLNGAGEGAGGGASGGATESDHGERDVTAEAPAPAPAPAELAAGGVPAAEPLAADLDRAGRARAAGAEGKA